jgi:4-hydroxythreonine-4-phosphate dehydrogenase
VAVGRPEVFRRAARLLNSPVEVVTVTSPDDLPAHPPALPCLACGSSAADDVPAAQIDPRGGQAAYDALTTAVELARTGCVEGIVTAPLNKAALWEAGHRYPGHTELLADLCGGCEVAMMLYLGPKPPIRGRAGLGVVHVTLHAALRNVFRELTEENILTKARLVDGVTRNFLAAYGIDAPPTIGVAALNPHGGEQGLFGDEEQRIIRPAVERGIREGLDLHGPLPCDTLMRTAVEGRFDAVVAMYHDQGHIALKLLGMHRAVNVTLGLPIIRTSVAHGTAFDLAWQGQAEHNSLIEAVRVAAMLAGATGKPGFLTSL